MKKSIFEKSVTPLEKLRRLVGVPGPGFEGQTYLSLTCTCDFEPHGRASETWEMVWILELPLTQHHWKNTQGKWVRGSNNAPKRFTGRYAEDVIQEAITFLEELKVQNEQAGN